ncbi:MAG: HD domain-containing protein [Candidatus Micrarchaeota archaeon]|nr:HD domain-containing protein [Candidatus Micrarchaeota archaeon]
MDKDLDRILRFMVEIGKLKSVKRTGWVENKISDPEHVADHSFSTAVMSYIMAKRFGLDAGKCVAMALIHDINEVITGDIATKENEKDQRISTAAKHKIESTNMRKMLSYLPKPQRGEWSMLWVELTEQKTPEAKLVKQIDSLDYIIQLVHYSKKFKNKGEIASFFNTAKKRISDRDLLSIYEKVGARVKPYTAVSRGRHA